MGTAFNVALLGFVVFLPAVQPFFLGALKTLIGAKLLGGLSGSSSSESQRSSVGFYADSESGQSSHEGLPALPMSASYSAKFQAPSPMFGSPMYYGYSGPMYTAAGNPTPFYGYPLMQQYGSAPSGFAAKSVPTSNIAGDSLQQGSIPVLTSRNAAPVYPNLGYPVDPMPYGNVFGPAIGRQAVPLGAYPFGLYGSQFPAVAASRGPAFAMPIPLAPPASNNAPITPAVVPANGVQETPAASTIDLSTLLRLAQAAESLPSASLAANMGAGATVNASIGRNARQEDLQQAIPEETLERYFQFLQQIDQDLCLSRLVCEVTADANVYGVYGRLYGRMISNYFLDREAKPESHLTPFVEAAKLGHENGMQGCAGSYSNCTLDLPHIIRSVRL